MKFTYVIIIVCSFVLSSCAVFEKQARVEPVFIIDVADKLCKDYVWKSDAHNQGSGKAGGAGENKNTNRSNVGQQFYNDLCIIQSGENNSGGLDRERRNSYIMSLVALADNICMEELAQLSGNQRGTNAILSILNTGLSTASTIVTGDGAHKILSGSATAIGASRDHINAEVYKNSFSRVVTKVIQEDRVKYLGKVLKKLQQKKEIYSLAAAIRDVNAYHHRCSYFHGLELITAVVSDPDRLSKSILAAEHELSRLERAWDKEKGKLAMSEFGEEEKKKIKARLVKMDDTIYQLNEHILSLRVLKLMSNTAIPTSDRKPENKKEGEKKPGNPGG